MFATVGAVLALAASVAAQNSSYSPFPPGVVATGTMGVTNPPQPTLGTAINQTSNARLVSLNSIDDFCIFAPPEPNSEIGNVEAVVVAWCSQARNNARVIPDGVITGVRYIETDFYVQLMGYGDLTKLNIPFGDYGGELDPHGPQGDGNPIGGNVTNNRTGGDVNYEEWMMFISYEQFCFRICTTANETYSAGLMCEHKLDVMGCQFVMPGDYNFNNTFESCEADVAYPPGIYPEVNGDGNTTYSTFAQYFTGVYTDGAGTPVSYTVGDLVTPANPAFTPSSSNCVTVSTVSNGIDLSAPTPTPPNYPSTGSPSGSSGSDGASPTPSGSDGGSEGDTDGASTSYKDAFTLCALISGIAAIALFH